MKGRKYGAIFKKGKLMVKGKIYMLEYMLKKCSFRSDKL
jgi:hypothetical protein